MTKSESVWPFQFAVELADELRHITFDIEESVSDEDIEETKSLVNTLRTKLNEFEAVLDELDTSQPE